jgi:hypothetical protein
VHIDSAANDHGLVTPAASNPETARSYHDETMPKEAHTIGIGGILRLAEAVSATRAVFALRPAAPWLPVWGRSDRGTAVEGSYTNNRHVLDRASSAKTEGFPGTSYCSLLTKPHAWPVFRASVEPRR